MTKKSKQNKILSFEKVYQIEKILGTDGICESDGSYILTGKDNKIVFIKEFEIVCSTKKGKKND